MKLLAFLILISSTQVMGETCRRLSELAELEIANLTGYPESFYEPPVQKLVVPDFGLIEIGDFLGAGVSRAFRSKDLRVLTKFYDFFNQDSYREYWLTRIYQDNDIPVTEIYGPPRVVSLPSGEMYWVVVKAYDQALSYEQFSVHFPEKIEDANREIESIRAKVDALHAGETIERWKTEHNLTYQLEEPDTGFRNFLYTQNGWVLNDP